MGDGAGHYLFPSRLREGSGEGMSRSRAVKQALPRPLPQAGGEKVGPLLTPSTRCGSRRGRRGSVRPSPR
ncbi:hypothetical protein C3E99_19115 [Sphingopyxis sp. MG]|nr:hypothetical protein C3E99_19115 [Sphingopyxis sp. MG]